MKVLSLTIFLFLSTSLKAQDAIIAVGEAELDKAKVEITQIAAQEGNFTVTNEKLARSMAKIILDDFAFYQHKFDVSTLESDLSKIKWEDYQGSEYLIGLKLKKDKSINLISISVFQAKTKSLVGEASVRLSLEKERYNAHYLADQAYQLITGKRSIFLSKIFFVSDKESTFRKKIKELYIMDFDGKRTETLTDYDSIVISPDVSPDNTKVMFSVIKDRKGKKKGQNIDLVVMDLKTKRSRPISVKKGINSGAIFSADGKKIYYTMTFSGNANIYELDLDGANLSPVTYHSADDVDPSVTADGSKMVFLSSRPGQAHIYKMDLPGPEKNVERISYIGKFNATPRFSPDGKEIVFSSWVDGKFDLYRIDANGAKKNAYRLTKDHGSNEEASFSPDGEFIVFTSQKVLGPKRALQNIYLMNREGKILGQLTKRFGQCFTPRWTK